MGSLDGLQKAPLCCTASTWQRVNAICERQGGTLFVMCALQFFLTNSVSVRSFFLPEMIAKRKGPGGETEGKKGGRGVEWVKHKVHTDVCACLCFSFSSFFWGV